jgi:hypothetical protein
MSYRRIRLRFCAEDCRSRDSRLFNKRFGTYKFLPLYALRPQRGSPNAPRRTEPAEVTVVSAGVACEFPRNLAGNFPHYFSERPEMSSR